MAEALDVWRQRMRTHTENGAAYVHVIVNERREAGASLPHTHAQIYALDFVPSVVARERERFGAYAQRTMGANLLQDLVQEEVKLRERIVAIDDEAVLMAPYGAQLPFQLMLAPRVPRARFEDDGPTGAALLHDGLNRLGRKLGNVPPLNLWVRTAPLGADHFCWRIDVVPRLTHMAGLELGAGVHLNIVAPEQAAAELREVLRCAHARDSAVSRAAVRVDGETVGAIGPGMLVLLGIAHDDDESVCDRLADKVRRAADLRRRRGPHERGAGRARGPRRQPVHALRRRAQGQPPLLRRRGAAPSRPSRSTSASPTASARPAASSAR